MLRVGGFRKNSFIDYPGKIACVLFLGGCNLRCPYCHNPELVLNYLDDSFLFDVENFFRFLKKRRGFLDAVVISGGEPTLQDKIFGLCERIKQFGYRIKLDTNGSRPQKIESLLKAGLLDYVAMDIKTVFEHYYPLISKDRNPEPYYRSIDCIMGSGIPFEFKTTCIEGLVDDAVVESISRLIEGANLYALQKFIPDKVLDPGYFQKNPQRFTDSDLKRFRSIASGFVKQCIVR
jgi:pyruvate formate lyase activating enzyme